MLLSLTHPQQSTLSVVWTPLISILSVVRDNMRMSAVPTAQGRPLIPRISKAHLKDPEAKLGDFRTTGIFIQLRLWPPSLSPECYYPVQTPQRCLLMGSQAGVKPKEAGVNKTVHGEFAAPVCSCYNHIKQAKVN